MPGADGRHDADLSRLRPPPGRHTLTVKVVDPTGFVRDPAIRSSAALTQTRTWTVDPRITTAPDFTGATSRTAEVANVPPGYGRHVIEYRAIDAAGNVGETSTLTVILREGHRLGRPRDRGPRLVRPVRAEAVPSPIGHRGGIHPGRVTFHPH